MAVNVQRLRMWFALAALAVVAVVAGFYGYARWRAVGEEAYVPRPLEEGVAQATEGFTLSRSEGGRTLFTVRASQAVQFREGGRAQLKDVTIIVHGRHADRFDRIYGADFLYDPEAGEITARGVVHIDLEAHGDGAGDAQQPPAADQQTPIRLRTSALVFNHKTGFAATREEVEFRFPQAGGTAQGATYDSRTNILTLESDVRVATQEEPPARLQARHAALSAPQRQVELQGVQVERGGRSFATDRMMVHLRADHSVERMLAEGAVRARADGPGGGEVRAAQAAFDFQAGARNALRQIALAGGVEFSAAGQQPMQGRSQRMVLEFAEGNQLLRAQALDSVRLVQQQAAQSVELVSQRVDFFFSAAQALQRAVTQGQAQIVVSGAAVPMGGAAAQETRTAVTAGRFEARFERGQLRSLQGAPDARIVSSAPGQPERVSTSREVAVQFAPGGAIAGIVQEGDFRYREGQRAAFAERARYDAARDELSLSGQPRVAEGGLAASADSIRLERRTGDALAEGNVKTTYTGLGAQPAGALLGGADPIHVTAPRMQLRAGGAAARYSGGARLWQGANIVHAPTLEFNRDQRTVVAQGTPGYPVTAVFLQPDAKGQPAPVNVTAARLSYADAQRRARFEGGVVARGADATVTAAQVDIFLQPLQKTPQAAESPSQVQQVVASGGVVVQQAARRATGEQLVYTSQDGKFVLSGGSPSIFDAERGTIQGDSLTFFSRDDRVLVGGQNSSRTVTRTRVQD